MAKVSARLARQTGVCARARRTPAWDEARSRERGAISRLLCHGEGGVCARLSPAAGPRPPERLAGGPRDARNQANPAVFDRQLDRWLAAPTDESDQTSCDRFASCANLVDAARELQDRRPRDARLGYQAHGRRAPWRRVDEHHGAAGNAARRRSACSSDTSTFQATASAVSRRGGRRRPRRRRRSPPGPAAFVLYRRSVRARRAAVCSAPSALALV